MATSKHKYGTSHKEDKTRTYLQKLEPSQRTKNPRTKQIEF
jgi:hypothetical protein